MATFNRLLFSYQTALLVAVFNRSNSMRSWFCLFVVNGYIYAMKKIALFTLSVFLAAVAFAQDTSIIYFSKDWKETGKENMMYYRKKFSSGKGWGVNDFYKNGTMQMRGTFSNDSCTMYDGDFTWYKDDGKVSRSCHYTQGEKDGSEILYYENGNKQMEGTYAMGDMVEEWTGYYPSGKLSAKALFKKDEQVSGQFYKEDGTANNEITVFIRQAAFRGGEKGLVHYLITTLAYPERAMKNNIQGQVVVQFIVKKDGSVSDIAIAQSVESSLDQEALRVVKGMPKWTPAIYGGRFCDSYMKQPVTFKFQ
jgi:TonB family protein